MHQLYAELVAHLEKALDRRRPGNRHEELNVDSSMLEGMAKVQESTSTGTRRRRRRKVRRRRKHRDYREEEDVRRSGGGQGPNNDGYSYGSHGDHHHLEGTGGRVQVQRLSRPSSAHPLRRNRNHYRGQGERSGPSFLPEATTTPRLLTASSPLSPTLRLSYHDDDVRDGHSRTKGHEAERGIEMENRSGNEGGTRGRGAL